jgi:hypothetical protein
MTALDVSQLYVPPRPITGIALPFLVRNFVSGNQLLKVTKFFTLSPLLLLVRSGPEFQPSLSLHQHHFSHTGIGTQQLW